MYLERRQIYRELEKEFDSKIISYITSDRPNMSARIASDVIDCFIDHLDKIGPCKRISLILYTRGGDTSAARNIVNLLRMYCDELYVIIPHKAHSAGTIISIGADKIIMTKQATLGPIDPSINNGLNPRLPEGDVVPVSVEAVKGYLDFAKNELGIKDEMALASIFEKLSDKVHPLLLGDVYRSKAQIQTVVEKLLSNQITDQEKVKKIIAFLCSESGSHDYTINRREAKMDLGLNVDKPSERQYKLIKSLYDDYSEELQFNRPFSYAEINGAYVVRRCLLESFEDGSSYYVTEGTVIKGIGPQGNHVFQNIINFEGWRHEQIEEEPGYVEENNTEEVAYEKGECFQQ